LKTILATSKSYPAQSLRIIHYLYIKMSVKQKQWITFKVSESEMRAIEAYCQQMKRTKTDVLREMIRKLPTYTNLASANDHNNSSDY